MSTRLTIVEKVGAQPISKRIFLDDAGQLRSDGSLCAITRGRALRVELVGNPAQQLAQLISELPSHGALILGDLRSDLPATVALDVKRRADPAKGTMARTRETFRYREGEPAFALVDHDQKGMPEDVCQRLAAAGGFMGAIARLLPGIERAATVTRASTSSGIVNLSTGERHEGSGGLHLYVLVQDGDLAAGGRTLLPLPTDDAELTPVVLALDEALSASTASDPLVRNFVGACCRVELRAPDALHLLTSAGAAGEEKVEDRLAAPVEPLITPYRLPGLRMRIEREVGFYAVGLYGNIEIKALQPHFAGAFAEFDGSKLPRIKGVVTTPLILPSGLVLTGDGFDRNSGLYFHIDPHLAGLVPNSAGAEDVQAAFRWLTDHLLPDVLTDDVGKAIAVAFLLTLIERLILDARPAFFITANLRGGGKTTLVHMMTLAVLGRMAPASAWSPIAEERRKSLFAALRQGVAALNWDNIPRGEGVSCPHIEASLTSPTTSDRVLGVSHREQVAATTVQSFTGNNVLPSGDLASRSLVIVLEARQLDPENRTFVHPDPFDWIWANRAKVMRALYTILKGNPLLGGSVEGQPTETRFRAWWHLCGHAVEYATNLHDPGTKVRFRELFLQSEEEDEEVTGTSDLLQALLQVFSGGEFTSADVVAKITAVDGSRADCSISDGLVRATRKSLKVFSSHTVGQRLKAIKDRPAMVQGRIMALRHTAKQKGGEQGKWRVAEPNVFVEELYPTRTTLSSREDRVNLMGPMGPDGTNDPVPVPSHPNSPNGFGHPTAGEHKIPILLAEAIAAGCEFKLRGGAITVRAKTPPPADLMVRLRQRKFELLQLLGGDRCRHCGEQVEHRRPDSLMFADGTGAHVSCAQQAEVERLLAAGRRAVADAVHTTDDGEVLTGEEAALSRRT